MASRSIADLDSLLAYAYGKAETEFLMTHPDGPIPFLTCTHRSNEEQTALYKQPTDGKDNDGDGKIDNASEKVTNAKAGESAHNFKPSMALDVAFKNGKGVVVWTNAYFAEFAQLMKKTPGVTWGGDWKSFPDRPHFERTNWQKLVK